MCLVGVHALVSFFEHFNCLVVNLVLELKFACSILGIQFPNIDIHKLSKGASS